MAGYCEKKDPLEFSTEIEKWDQETPADGKEMAKPIEKLYNNTEFNKKGVEDVKNPEFDASGNASGITNFQKLIDSITSKMSIFSFFANLKTGLKYVLDVGKIVNNGTTTEAGKFVLDAIQANASGELPTSGRFIVQAADAPIFFEGLSLTSSSADWSAYAIDDASDDLDSL